MGGCINEITHLFANRRIRDPYARWCERLSLSVSGRAVYSITCWPSVCRVAVWLVNIKSPCHYMLCLSGRVTVYFYFFEALGNFLKTIFVCVGKASSFAIFGLCVGLCELQMCLLSGLAFLWFHKY